MDEIEDFEDFEENEPIEGQICYDELEPIEEENNEQIFSSLDGQLNIEGLNLENGNNTIERDFSMNKKNKNNLNIQDKTNNELEKNLKNTTKRDILSSNKESKLDEFSIINEIEKDREISNPNKNNRGINKLNLIYLRQMGVV